MVDLGERMLMKVVTVVPIFAGVAASANSESRGHTSNRRLTRTIAIPPYANLSCSQMLPRADPRASGTRAFLAARAPFKPLSYRASSNALIRLLLSATIEVMSGCRGGPGELVNRLLSPASNRLARGSADPSGENRPP